MADKFPDLIKRLAEKTEAGQIRWERTAEEGRFIAPFPNYSVAIYKRELGSLLGKRVVVELQGKDSLTIDEYVEKGLFPNPNAAATAGLANRLWEDARRIAMGTDEALEDLLKQLG
jgi:hypothetical protein